MAIKSKVKKLKFSVNKERTSNKAVICARVSTTDQEDNHSLVAQRDRLIEYCKRNRFEIIKEFEIVESSTKGDRPKFQAMLQFIEEQKEPINLVCDKVDRLQRSIMDISKIDDLVTNHNMVLHFLDIGRLDNDSNASQKAFYRIAVVFANAYTDAISDNVKRSIGKKLKEGTILGQATLGYINKERPNKKLEPDAIVLIDPSRAPLVKRMFEDYATGAYSIKHVMQNATKAGLRTLKGHKLSHSTVEGILKQPFYYGYMQSGGEFYKHRYEPLITKELYDICQDIRAGKTTNKTRIPKNEEDFIYRGLLKCHHCKCVYSPDPKQNRKYMYMKPTKSQGYCEFCVYVKEEIITAQIEHVIKDLTITKETLEAIKPELKKVLEENKSLNEIKFDELNKKLKNIEKRQEELIESLTEDKNDESITLDEIQKMNTVLSMKKTQIQDELLSLDINKTSTRNSVLTIFELAEGMYDIFTSSNNIKKRELIKILFSNLELSGLNLHYSLQKPFDLLQKQEGQPVWLPSHTEFRTYNESFDGDILAKNGDLEGDDDGVTFNDEDLENDDIKTSSRSKKPQIDLSSETENLLLSRFAKDTEFQQKVRSIKSLAQTLNDGYSKEVVLFFEDNQHIDLGSLKVV